MVNSTIWWWKHTVFSWCTASALNTDIITLKDGSTCSMIADRSWSDAQTRSLTSCLSVILVMISLWSIRESSSTSSSLWSESVDFCLLLGNQSQKLSTHLWFDFRILNYPSAVTVTDWHCQPHVCACCWREANPLPAILCVLFTVGRGLLRGGVWQRIVCHCCWVLKRTNNDYHGYSIEKIVT